MSCGNLTSGIAKGCNYNVGGLQGIHYRANRFSETPVLDANGVVVQWEGDAWEYLELDNGTANLVETYNINQAGSALGFTQSLNFFIPDNATPTPGYWQEPAAKNVSDWVRQNTKDNNMDIIVETQHATVTRGLRPKCFLFGNERGAYINGGQKQTGVNYTDNNGYTIEIQANSKEPMLEVDYMVQHLQGPAQFITPALNAEVIYEQTTWDYSPLIPLLGANVRVVIPAIPLVPALWVQPGQLITYKARITAIWSQNCWGGGPGTFQLTANGRVGTVDIPATITNPPNTYIPGAQQTFTVEYTYEYTGSVVESWTPLFFDNAVGINQPITEAGNIPIMSLQIFAQTT